MKTATDNTPADATASTLSAFVHGLRLEQVPPEISIRARHLMLDAVGCALAARREEFAARFAGAVTALGADVEGGGSAVIGHSRRLPMRDAALLNGVLSHGLDYDDTHMAGVIHLSVSVLPALLAMGGRRRSSGAEMLTAYIAALEAGARIASVAKSGFHAHGFHPTGIVGAFASSLGAGRLMGLSAKQLVHAQGAALSMASGSLQFIEDGAWTKRFHPGWAAQAGITAATFAAHGIGMPQSPYEGRYGFYRLYLGEAEHAAMDLALATAGLGPDGEATHWEIENIAVKPFPMCHFVHASADAAIALQRQGLDVSQVRSVEVLVPAGVVQAVCEPLGNKRRPTSDYDAKFSLPYAVASGLLRGKLGLKELEPAAYQEPAVLALMDRITYAVDPGSTFPRHYTGEVRVTLDDGRRLVHRESINRGHAERPLSNAEVRDKYFDNARLHFSSSQAQSICDQVLALDRHESVQQLEDLLAQEPDDVAAPGTASSPGVYPRTHATASA